MKEFKVLSIDFDYFQNIPYSSLSAYPDGIDLPLEVSNIIWASKLAYCSKAFDNVEFDNEGFGIVTETIKAQSPSIPVCIANSHLIAYQFVKTIKQQFNQNNISLVNVDLHHDILNNNDNVDCGNWIGYLINENAINKFKWIAKPLSQKMYGFNDVEFRKMCANLNINQILNEKFDAIFICKSVQWVLPTFDSYFKELVEICRTHFQPANLTIESKIDTERKFAISNLVKDLK